MKTTAQGLPESRALAPPSASCAECLDNWMEYLAGRVLPGSLSSDFKRRGKRGCWLQKEAQEAICGLGGPPPRPDQYRRLPSPLCGGELESGPWGKDRTEGGGSRMVSEVCGGQLGEVRPRGQSGSGRARTAFWSHDCDQSVYQHSHLTEQLGPKGGGARPKGLNMLGTELGWNPGLLTLSLLFSLSRLSPTSPPAPSSHTHPSQ